MITRSSARSLGAWSSKAWVCPSCTKTSSSQFLRLTQQRRTLYNVPRLSYDKIFDKDGIKGLFSAGGYQLGWSQYQTLLIQKLNDLLGESAVKNKDVKELALHFAHNPSAASTFNHASMAHNNHFFYQQFSTAPRSLEQYPSLKASLVEQFGSIETLRTTFVDTAASMFGPGFVWLVWAREPEQYTRARNGSWKILCTYNAGTPYPEAGFMRQGLDMNNNDGASLQQYKSSLSVGYMGQQSNSAKEKARLPPGGTSLMPVLCVSTCEHTYIFDYGLRNKVDFLNSFWNAVDWHVVEHRSPKETLEKVYRPRDL